MNEQALRDAYELFVAEGYQGSFEDYIVLINGNPKALEDSYTLFQAEGYNKPIEDFQVLLGVKKKRRWGIYIRGWFIGATNCSAGLFHRATRK